MPTTLQNMSIASRLSPKCLFNSIKEKMPVVLLFSLEIDISFWRKYDSFTLLEDFLSVFSIVRHSQYIQIEFLAKILCSLVSKG